MSSKHIEALEALFSSVEEEIGAAAGPKTCDALGTAREVISDHHRKKKKK